MTEIITAKGHSSSLGGTVFKNTVFLTSSSLVLKLLNFLFNIYVVRRLGDNRLGEYAVVLAFVGLFQIFAELGISQYVMREIAKDRSRTKSLIWNMTAVRMLLAILALVWITLLAMAFGFSQTLVIGVFIFTSTFVLSAVLAPIQTVLTANERFDYVTAVTIIQQIAFVLLGAIFLYVGLGYLWLVIASWISLIPSIILGAWAVRHLRLIEPGIEVTPRTWPKLLRAGLPFGIIALTLTISFSIDTVMLKMFKTNEVVGWYNAAYHLIFAINFLTEASKTPLSPR